MDETKGSIKGAAAIRAASVLLVAIVSIFLLYANNIFIKRRSKEIGLFQLVGMTKGKIFRILSVENFPFPKVFSSFQILLEFARHLCNTTLVHEIIQYMTEYICTLLRTIRNL